MYTVFVYLVQWPLDPIPSVHFGGGRGEVQDIQPTNHIHVHFVFGPNGLWSLSGGGDSGHPAYLPYMCTLYLAQMAYGHMGVNEKL